ncbi:nucleotide-diphospho-sugar transferase [Polynucleobacter sp. MWH-CaK5]|uniref:hypothetical protein n=1 Tax=Polynucleobacter sp. MWH-CaK5 TaxID=2689107 RepID=UPI001BFDA145|nr:hypothetical protein [Polynucleobacter sp. MWH-CaK5]QWD89165.1 nucleotide-diphospho-sugar transferase [Polynucleobacter sp. MWH-CaK5]
MNYPLHLDIPVLVIFFNRPSKLKENLQQLSKVKPRNIYFTCDGPRNNSNQDLVLIRECQDLIDNYVTWECTVNTYYSNINYGCDEWVPRSITWFFSHVDRGIILEDDCLVGESFFIFSQELLTLFQNNSKVMNISAANFQSVKFGDADYYFSKYPANWAWATWKRAWDLYDSSVEGLDDFFKNTNNLSTILKSSSERKYWRRFFLGLKSGKYTFWDAKWLYSIWKNNALSISPNINMVKNIGFGSDATHTQNLSDDMNMRISDLTSSISHPILPLEVNADADYLLFKNRYKPKLLARIKFTLLRIWRAL